MSRQVVWRRLSNGAREWRTPSGRIYRVRAGEGTVSLYTMGPGSESALPWREHLLATLGSQRAAKRDAEEREALLCDKGTIEVYEALADRNAGFEPLPEDMGEVVS